MQIIDKVKMPGYTQWCSDFVANVIIAAKIPADQSETVEIIGVDNRRITITINEKMHTIRMWNFTPLARDENNMVCKELVNYTLFDVASDPTSGVAISRSSLQIQWSNDPAIKQKELEVYKAQRQVAG